MEQIRGGVMSCSCQTSDELQPDINHKLKKKDKPVVCCKVHRKLAQHRKHLGTDFLVDKVQEESSMH